jgi:hypothetical protein
LLHYSQSDSTAQDAIKAIEVESAKYQVNPLVSDLLIADLHNLREQYIQLIATVDAVISICQ